MMKQPLVVLKQKRKKFPLIFLFMFILLTITLACNLPFRIVWNDDSEANQQATDQAKTAMALSADVPQSEDEEEGQAEPDTPAETPSPSPSPTITSTPTPKQVVASVTKNTNCRVGPKDVYELIHIFKKGDSVELVGKNQEETFWYIQNQDGSIECWMWNEYTTTEGNTANLPVFTPPPSPIPFLNFVLTYKNTTGEKSVNVYLRNTGNIPLESYSATFKDLDTSETLTKSNNKFGSMASVSVGNTTTISSPNFSASTVGHQMKVTVKACTLDGQSGKCKTISINFESK
jgi:uncharacterized protein YgiM (DUF1202 family)